VLEIQEIKLSKLKPWEDNPRLNDHAVDAVAQSICTFGFNVPILCDRDFTIIAGHIRWKAAQKMGMKTVPVIVLPMSKPQRCAFSVADNKTARIAEWDLPKLRTALEDLRSEDVDLLSLGFCGAELEALLTSEENFDWRVLDQQLVDERARTYLLLRIKVPLEMKSVVQEAIREYAKTREISGNDFPIIAGKVLIHLLGLSK